MSQNYYKSGDWNVICDSCGVKFKASQLRKRWDGFMVCEADWEPRHPSDLLKIPPEGKPVPWTRPEATDVFVSVTYSSAGNQETSAPAGSFTADATQH